MEAATPRNALISFAELVDAAELEPRHSDWLEVPLCDVQEFGRLTGDPDPNHIDPVWAASHSPYRQSVLFGFQTLSLLTWLANSAGAIPKDAEVFNYGLDKVRFVGPVPVGSRIRGTFSIKWARERAPGRVLVCYSATVIVKGSDQPALVADWLGLYQGLSQS